MTSKKRQVIGGVDTHRDTHHAAAIDQTGGLLGDAEFPAAAIGYAALLAWLRGYGSVVNVGVEGTGSYGAGLALPDQPQGKRGRGRPSGSCRAAGTR
jgi:transposase